MIDTCFFTNQLNFIVIPEFSYPRIPKDIFLEVFSRLKFLDLVSCSEVNKDWKLLANDNILLKKIIYREKTFNPEDWKSFFGMEIPAQEVKKAWDSLPKNIGEIFKGACPVFKGKKFGMTHVISWMPAGLSINQYAKFLRSRYPYHLPGIHEIWQSIIVEYGDGKISKGKWVAMSKTSLRGSLGLGFEEQALKISKIEAKKFKSCKIPKALEAIVCISTTFFKSKNPIFYKLYTRCRENVDGCHVLVGFVKGLNVLNLDFYGNNNVGAATLIKFK